jgi:hypothetical protein
MNIDKELMLYFSDVSLQSHSKMQLRLQVSMPVTCVEEELYSNFEFECSVLSFYHHCCVIFRWHKFASVPQESPCK